MLYAGLLAGAQEAGEADPQTDAVSVRPAETDLLFDQTPEEAGDPEDPEPADLPGVGFGDFVRVIIVLGVVIALIYAFVWMLKKMTGVKAEGGDEILLYSTRPLKGDAALHLVEAGNRIFLIGSSGNSINLISEIDDKESIDAIRLNASTAAEPAGGGFARLFKDRFGQGPAPEAPQTPASEDPVSYLRKQRERLKDL